MEKSHLPGDRSRIGIQFGDNIEPENEKMNLNLNVDISAKKAEAFKKEIVQATNNKIDTDYSFIIKLSGIPTDKQAQCIEILNSKITHDKIVKKSIIVNNTIYYSIKMTTSLEKAIFATFKEFMTKGLNKVAENQESWFNIQVSSRRTFNDIANDLEKIKTMIFLQSLLKNMKLEFQFTLAKDFAVSLNNLIKKVIPKISDLPPLVFLGYFKSLDMDYKFNSISDLDPKFQDNIMPDECGLVKLLALLQPDALHLLEDIAEGIASLVSEPKGEYYMILPQFAVITGKFLGPGFSRFFTYMIHTLNENEKEKVDLKDVNEEMHLEMTAKRVDKRGQPVNIHERKDEEEKKKEKTAKRAKAYSSNEPDIFKSAMGSLIAPTNEPSIDQSLPSESLKLEYAHGYRTEETRNNIYIAYNGDIVYYLASLGIMLNSKNNTQKFLGGGEESKAQGHNDDITAIAISPDRRRAVTGQTGKEPFLVIWNLENQTVVAKANLGKGNRSVKTLCFSPDSKSIFSTTMDEAHSVQVIDSQTGTILAKEQFGPSVPFDADAGNETSNFTFGVTGSKYTIYLYSFKNSTISKKKALFGSNENMVDQACIQFFSKGDKFITGSVKGHLFIWNGINVVKVIQAHQGVVHSIKVGDGKVISSGSVDKTLKVYTEDMKEERTIIVEAPVKAIDYYNKKVVYGCRDGTIFEYFPEDEKSTIIMDGHGYGEVWGLEICPKTGLVVTTGDDNKIICFDPKENKVISRGIINEKPGPKPKALGASTLSSLPPNQCSRAVAMNGQTGHVAIACNNGEITIRESSQNLNKVIAIFKHAKEWIEAMDYSPNGAYLAAGSHDNLIYVYAVKKNYNLISTLKGHNSFITNLDWSTDSKFLHTNCGAYELLFFDVEKGIQLTHGATSLRDEQWATFTCKISWPTQGVFPDESDGNDINYVDRNKAKNLIATGDDFRKVVLYRFPCMGGSKGKSYIGHSEHVLRVKFNNDDSYLYSVGGSDCALFKWKVIKH